MTGALVVQADARALPLPDASVDAIVCDPPYALSFMGRKWDTMPPVVFQAWCNWWATEALRVLKPGGWLLAFGGTRTWHRLTCGIEDAGFEMRDTIADFEDGEPYGPLAWVYGQGFPKGRACLKPGWEPVVVARKPGSSVLQIDACRVGGMPPSKPQWQSAGSNNNRAASGRNGEMSEPHPAGRWPANVVLTHTEDCQPVGTRKVRGDYARGANATKAFWGERGAKPDLGYVDPDGTETVEAWDCSASPDCPVALLDQQSGTLTSGANPTRRGSDKFRSIYGDFVGQEACTPARGVDQGGASRFFYTAKADASERVTIDGDQHPTVKPLDLVRWLVRLVTPPGGLVLDMFGGSGTTGEAAMLEGFTALVIDKDPASCAKAKVRAHPYVRRRVVVTGPAAVPEQGSLL